MEAEEAAAALFERVFGQPPVLSTNEETLVTEVSYYGTHPGIWSARRRRELEEGLVRIRETGLPLGRASIRVRWLKPRNWAESWKRHFRPLAIGGRLLIRPTWSLRRPRSGEVLVQLDPGLSFGTGQHPTTAFCLGQIVSAWRPDRVQSLLDLGTGSGILAIAAAKLGFRPVTAIDFDPAAVKVARENARLNHVDRVIRLARKDLRRMPEKPAAEFDLVCANLLDDLLIAEQGRIVRRVRPGGCLVLAGILDRQFAAVRRVYEEAGLRLADEAVMGEWHSGAFRRPEKGRPPAGAEKN